MKSGNLNFLEPSGLVQACNGSALPLICINNNNNNNNNAVINNNYGRLQEFILLFKILKDMRKDFFEIYREFGRAPSKLRVSENRVLRKGSIMTGGSDKDKTESFLP